MDQVPYDFACRRLCMSAGPLVFAAAAAFTAPAVAAAGGATSLARFDRGRYGRHEANTFSGIRGRSVEGCFLQVAESFNVDVTQLSRHRELGGLRLCVVEKEPPLPPLL